ncbi:hypothetical protein Tco_0530816 [Tanacetum coccineum]
MRINAILEWLHEDITLDKDQKMLICLMEYFDCEEVGKSKVKGDIVREIAKNVPVSATRNTKCKAKEQEQFITKQKATLFKELLKQRRKHFAAKRAEEKRNKPPTNIQQKKTMITYLKNMEG